MQSKNESWWDSSLLRDLPLGNDVGQSEQDAEGSAKNVQPNQDGLQNLPLMFANNIGMTIVGESGVNACSDQI